MKTFHYLQVTHIPFTKRSDGHVTTDQLWANDLHAIARSIGPVRVAAPQLDEDAEHLTWGPKTATIPSDGLITFAGFPAMRSRRDYWKLPCIRSVLKREVQAADLVHSSNFFPPYLGLVFAHRYAVGIGKKTLFAIPEDFCDMLGWEWVRTASGGWQRWQRERELCRMDRLARECARSADMTFLFTPAAVELYRLDAKNGVAVRDTTHKASDVISSEQLERKCRAVQNGEPLTAIAVCRHHPLKGVDLIIRAAAELKRRRIPVRFKLFGHGSGTEGLQELARYLGVSDTVSFPGALDPQAVYSEFAAADIGLMAHRTHDFARSFYDSLTGGAPVVAFRTPASSGTVREGVDGLLPPLDNVIAFSLAIERLHRDRDLLAAMAQNARQRALVETQETWHNYRAERIREIMQ